jgi:hypothetical protein
MMIYKIKTPELKSHMCFKNINIQEIFVEPEPKVSEKPPSIETKTEIQEPLKDSLLANNDKSKQKYTWRPLIEDLKGMK